MPKKHVSTRINGQETEFLCSPEQSMLEVLRDTLQLTGTKEGCSTGDCGACSVLLDGTLVCSCLMFAAEAEGCEVTTIEGIASGTTCIRCSRNSLRTRHCNAACAHPASLSQARRFLMRIPTLTSRASATGWLAIYAAAPATTRLCARCRTPPWKCATPPQHPTSSPPRKTS